MAAHSRLIDRYAEAYRPGHRTVVLIPGALGTRLDRTTAPFQTDHHQWSYETVWMDAGILFGDARALAIRPNGRDADSHIIVPNGPLRSMTGRPYDRTARFFQGELGLNYVVFGYDWRRPVEESAGFLEQFLDQLRDRIKARHDEDPLPRTTLLCHSMGGLVAQRFLQRVLGEALYSTEVDLWMERMVTVGTPFYGASTHMRRYYAGQEPLNLIYGAENVAALCGNLPGPYALLFLDHATYDAHATDLELERYPMRDAAGDGAADPYDPSLADRWPPWVEPDFLRDARELRGQLAVALPVPVADRIFHLRSGNDDQTPVELTWLAVNGADHRPGAELPLRITPGPGDGTVPYWSARLAQVDASRVYDLPTAEKHERLMEHDETLAALGNLITTGALPTSHDAPAPVRTAPAADDTIDEQALQGLLTAIAAGEVERTDPRVQEVSLWNRLIDDLGLC